MDVWSDTQRQDEERTHPRNNKSGAGFQKDPGEATEIVRLGDEKRKRTHSEESAAQGWIYQEKDDGKQDGRMHANEI